MQAADGKNFVDVPEGLSVPHETRHEPAKHNGSDRAASERFSRISANRFSLRPSRPPAARPPTGESSFRPMTNAT
jgi:hypothetical protein